MTIKVLFLTLVPYLVGDITAQENTPQFLASVRVIIEGDGELNIYFHHNLPILIRAIGDVKVVKKDADFQIRLRTKKIILSNHLFLGVMVSFMITKSLHKDIASNVLAMMKSPLWSEKLNTESLKAELERAEIVLLHQVITGSKADLQKMDVTVINYLKIVLDELRKTTKK